MIGRGLAMLLALASLAPAMAEVKIVGKVLHAGYPRGWEDYYRAGAWCPVLVELQNVGSEHLSGRLVLQQRDKDGDVMIAETVLSLTAGGQPRTYRLDFVADRPGGAGAFVVNLHDEQGQPLLVYDENGQPHEALPTPRALQLTDESSLVLDLSSRPVPGLDRFADDSSELLSQSLVLARFRPEDLPDRWYALQAVQAIIWDAPDVGRLNPAQIEALMDYVRAGGILVLGANRTAETLAASPLGRILPATVKGTRSADVLATVWDKMLTKPLPGGGRRLPPPQYVPPIGLAAAHVKPEAVSVCPQDDLGIDVVTRGRWGSGVVVFLAAPLRDLFKGGGDRRQLLKRVLGLRDAPEPPQGRRVRTFMHRRDLYDYMHGIIGFEAVSGWFLVFVVLFVAAYILLATLATWGWLRHRGALQHCWLVFAVVVLGSGVLSIGAVRAVRGIGMDLRQMSIIDVTVPADNRGTLAAQGVVYFGLKTSAHDRLDLRLASPDAGETEAHGDAPRAYLQPLPPGESAAPGSYVAPERYYLRAGQAMMASVPIRATLKRLQGYWFGQLDGSFSALVARDSRGGLDERSWIRNDLGVDLRDCWLILPRSEQIGGRDPNDPNDGIYVYPLDQPVTNGSGPYPIAGVTQKRHYRFSELQEWQDEWADEFRGMLTSGPGRDRVQPEFEMSRFTVSLMLLTTLDEYSPYAAESHAYVQFGRSHGLHLDRCHLLTSDVAMLIGFASTPGPARLEVGREGRDEDAWLSIEPEKGFTMFRIIIPVRRAAG